MYGYNDLFKIARAIVANEAVIRLGRLASSDILGVIRLWKNFGFLQDMAAVPASDQQGLMINSSRVQKAMDDRRHTKLSLGDRPTRL